MVREQKVARGPRAPSAGEKEKHEASHLPHEVWCDHCVRGRSREDAHSASTGTKEVAAVSLDYCFVGKKGEEPLKVLVVRDRDTKAVYAHAVRRKGGDDSVVRVVAGDLDLVTSEWR